MNAHPGGEEHTRHMLALAKAHSGRVIDLGAGAGESLRLMQSLGIDAVGVDISPRSETVIKADMHALPYGDSCFDAALSQCSFFVSGDTARALAEAYRVLRPGGVLMLSDVCFEDVAALITQAGFKIEYTEDMTQAWREYYIEALWSGNAECCNIRGKCKYMLFICRKV